jgi:arabinogalactan oligomer/maltooligosaccharide transport system permease protein
MNAKIFFRFLKPAAFAAGVLAALALAWVLRWHAVTTLSVDYDEDDYLRAAQQYAALIRSGDWAGLMAVNYRSEHPPLAKILYGASIAGLPEAPLIPDRPTSAGPDQNLPRDLLRAARTSGAVLGTLTVGVVALFNPWAGILLAGHAFSIKYVSQVMLEALPALTSLLMVVSYIRWKKSRNRRISAWLLVSAVFLGLTAASKYIYAVAGLALLLDWFLDARSAGRLRAFLTGALIWGGVGLLVFFAADPYLWPDPPGRLSASVLYHAAYSTGASEVQQAGFPLWQPLVWLNTSPAALGWQREAFPLALDPFVAVLACFGLAGLWRRERVFVLWLGLGLGFLFLWPTKWPQYILVLTAPLSLAAAEGLAALVGRPLVARLRAGRSAQPARGENRGSLRRALPWLLPGTLVFLLFTLLPLLFQLGVSLTDFNSASIRDGLQGGILREVWRGLSGQVDPAQAVFPFRFKEVRYIGPTSYLPLVEYLTAQGILVFNFLWTVISVFLQTSLGVGVALLLRRKHILFRRAWQALFILPWAIPEMIGALMWFNVFAPETGWLSLAVKDHGAQVPLAFLLNWIRDLNLLMLVLLISAVWYGFPFIMLIAITGLKMIPKDAYDAAAMDGAGSLSTFRFVTLPLLLPLLLPAVIIRGVFAFNQFYLFQAFYYPEGTLAALSYNFFNPSGYFINGQFSLSAVINIVTVLVLAGFVALFNRLSKAGEGVTYA